MGEWVSANGAVIRQRSYQRKATMEQELNNKMEQKQEQWNYGTRVGTLPENAYFEELTPVSQQRNNRGDEVERTGI